MFTIHCLQANSGKRKPNILWLTIEDSSPYQFGCYGNKDIKTPEIDAMAKEGILYTHASSTAPHCSPARSTLITGCYATTFGMDIHREDYDTPADIFYPKYLHEAGYFCTNNSKTDYNTTVDNTSMWDECNRNATYSSPQRKAGQPFFSVFNAEATHMGLVRTITTTGRPDLEREGIHPDQIFLPPHVPDLPEARSDESMMLKASRESSKWVQAFRDDLREKGLEDNTIIFFFSDHGGCLPRGKGLPFESGLRVPLIIYVPPSWQKELGISTGIVDTSLVGFVDFAPTILSLAGIEPPAYMQGRAFLGKYSKPLRELQFGFRSNQENYHYDPCRTATDGRYKYIRNYIPHKPFCLRNLYQWGMPANQAWDKYVMSGECKEKKWLLPYGPKKAEMLFDLEKDPWELNNLADDPKHAQKLKYFRNETSRHVRETKDLGFVVRGMRKKEGGLFSWVHQQNFPLIELYEAAELASRPTVGDVKKLTELLDSPYPELRYWGAIGFCTLGSQNKITQAPIELVNAVDDGAWEVATAASEALCYLGKFELGMEKLIELFQVNFNLAYSSIETLTWYPEQKKKMMAYLPLFKEMSEQQQAIKQTRMGLAVKVRSILVNLDAIPVSELYSDVEMKEGIISNKNGRKFRYPRGI